MDNLLHSLKSEREHEITFDVLKREPVNLSYRKMTITANELLQYPQISFKVSPAD